MDTIEKNLTENFLAMSPRSMTVELIYNCSDKDRPSWWRRGSPHPVLEHGMKSGFNSGMVLQCMDCGKQ